MIDNKEDFKSEVSMAKHFVANALGRIIDRAIQVHGALGYSTDTPLAKMYQHARWPGSPTVPTRSIRCELLNAQSPPTRTSVQTARLLAICRSSPSAQPFSVHPSTMLEQQSWRFPA